MNLTRRNLLLAGLGATQLGLLSKLGLGTAHAAPTGAPTKLLTIYVPGGWLPQLLFPSMSDAQIPKQITLLGENDPRFPAVFYKPSDVIAASTGARRADPGANAIKQPLCLAKLWNPADLTQSGGGFNANGYAWVKNKLWENTCVMHGIDQGTADHVGGQIASMSGAAGSEYRCPSMHAVVANALYAKYKDNRPLASVSVGSLLYPNAFGLPAGSPTIMPDLPSLKDYLSQRTSLTWKDLGERSPAMTTGFDGKSPEELPLNAMDKYLLSETAALRGKSNARTDSYFETVYARLAGTSKLLARDVVAKLEGTTGLSDAKNYGDYSETLVPQFDMALRLLRSNLATSIAIDAHGPKRFFFDTHGAPFGYDPKSSEYGVHGEYLKRVHEVIGTFLGEMKASPGVAGGANLLDETLVVIMSDFGRNPGNNDHWPTTSTILVGGGITTDTQIGNYDVEGKADKHAALGLPVEIKEESGQITKRRPKASDVCATVYKIMGVDSFFIPGGFGEITGVAKI
jgi:hypothetical protein